MEKITPDAILKQHGKWISRDKWIDLVSKARNVKPRQAWNIIKKEKKRAIKHVYSDRSTVYGLLEFGPPTPKIEGSFGHFGFFEWLEKRATTKRLVEKERLKQHLLNRIHYQELLAESAPDEYGIFKKTAEQDREKLKLLEQDNEDKN